MAKRVLDLVISILGLLALCPLLLLLAIWIKLDSRGPVLYRGKRVGLDGRPFLMYKFRTMVLGAESQGPAVTYKDDPRITKAGRFLRRTKLDELPQLWNVVRGDMSLVGPRPEVPRYVAHYTPEQRQVLEVRPGITDPATLEFRDEEDLLASVPPESREAYYLQEVLPRKLELNLAYLERRGPGRDLWVIGRTLLALLPGRRGPSRSAQKP